MVTFFNTNALSSRCLSLEDIYPAVVEVAVGGVRYSPLSERNFVPNPAPLGPLNDIERSIAE